MPKGKLKEKTISSRTLKPSPDSVSLILPYLYLGPSSATSATSTFVTSQGITHIISVGKKPQSTLDSITYLRLTLGDDPSADLTKAGGEAVAFINNARAKKSSKIFVHCYAGISRSPTIVAFYLMHSCSMSLRRALALIIGARPIACPNPGFISQLQQAETRFRGSSSLPGDLMSLPRKKEERLALFREEQINLEPPKSTVRPFRFPWSNDETPPTNVPRKSSYVSESSKENPNDEPNGCT